jgi:hypothetical protein
MPRCPPVRRPPWSTPWWRAATRETPRLGKQNGAGPPRERESSLGSFIAFFCLARLPSNSLTSVELPAPELFVPELLRKSLTPKNL